MRQRFIAAYQPAVDLTLHELAGYVAADCAHWSAAREKVVMPLLVDLLADLDSGLGETRALASAEDRIVITWTMTWRRSISRYAPTSCFRRGVLSNSTGKGAILPRDSLLFFHPAENGLLCSISAVALQGAPEPSVDAGRREHFSRGHGTVSGRRPVLSERLDLETIAGQPDWLSGAATTFCGGRFVQLKPDTQDVAVEPSTKTGEHVSPYNRDAKSS